MRTAGGLHSQIWQRNNLLRAVHQAARGRRAQPAVQDYLLHLDDELARLHDQLADAEPRCGECQVFTIYDPKERQITAPVFRERVLHHAVMNICGPVLDRRLMHHSYACRIGKGTFAALEAARRAAQAAPWFLKLDVRKYFASIPHAGLMRTLERVFRERTVLRILESLVRGYSPGASHGLPIGTLASQHLANFYLAALDTHVLQAIRPTGYVRYMDDLALWFGDAAAASDARDRLTDFSSHHLGLGFKTAAIHRSDHGMSFLGHRVYPHHLTLNRVSRRRYQRKIRAVWHAWVEGHLAESDAQQRGQALTAFTRYASGHAWRAALMKNWDDKPQAETVSCVVAAGSTTAGTPGPPIATTTRRRTRTTTLASGPAAAPTDGWSPLVEPACHPASPSLTANKTQPTPPLAGSPRSSKASNKRERRGFTFPENPPLP